MLDVSQEVVASGNAPAMSPADRAAHDLASYVRPSRRLVAAGVKRGAGPLIVEQPQPTDLTSVR